MTNTRDRSVLRSVTRFSLAAKVKQTTFHDFLTPRLLF